MTPEEQRIVELFTGRLEPLKRRYRIRVEGHQRVAKLFEVEAEDEVDAKARFDAEEATFLCDDWGDWEASQNPDALWIFPVQPDF